MWHVWARGEVRRGFGWGDLREELFEPSRRARENNIKMDL